MNGIRKTSKKRDRSNENFKKTCTNVMDRCDKIRGTYGADVYVLIRRSGKFLEYTSNHQTSWPPTRDEVSRSYPLPTTRTPEDYTHHRNMKISEKGIKDEAVAEQAVGGDRQS